MKIAALKLESSPAIIPPCRGHARTMRTFFGNSSIKRFSPFPCESLTTISPAPASFAARTAASVSSVIKCRKRSYSNPLGSSWSAVTVPATPSMSTEIYTFSFFAESPAVCAAVFRCATRPIHRKARTINKKEPVRNPKRFMNYLSVLGRKKTRIARKRLLLSSRRSRRKSERHFPRRDNRIHMDPDRIFDSPRISPSQSRRDGNPPPPCLFEHPPVASFQPILGQRQSAKLVLAKRIRPANIKKYLRPKLIQRRLHRRNQRTKIFVILRTVRHLQIHVRRRLVRRIIIFLMDRKREHRFIICKNRRRAISLMHIRIHNHRLSNRPILPQPSNRHRNIMNRAESLAMPRISMMKSAAQIASKPITQSRLPRQNRPARRQPTRLHRLPRKRNLQFHNLASGKRASL